MGKSLERGSLVLRRSFNIPSSGRFFTLLDSFCSGKCAGMI